MNGGEAAPPNTVAGLRAKYGITEAGAQAVLQLQQQGVGIDVIKDVSACLNDHCEQLAQGCVQSGPAFLGCEGAAFAKAKLPAPELWYNLLRPNHRSHVALERARYRCCAFVQAQIACMRMRGESTDHLFPDGNPGEPKVDMFRVVASWPHMDVQRFEDVVRLLVYAGMVGCASTFDNYAYDIGRLAKKYHSLAKTGVPEGDPFKLHPDVSENLLGFFRASPLAVTRKMARLSPGQIGSIVEDMYVGGLAMLQARFILGHMSLAGTRTPHFTFLRWRDVRLTKTVFRDAKGNQLTGYTAAQFTEFDKYPTVRGARMSAFNSTGLTQENTEALVGNLLAELGQAMDVFEAGPATAGTEMKVRDECQDWYVICLEHDCHFCPYINAIRDNAGVFPLYFGPVLALFVVLRR